MSEYLNSLKLRSDYRELRRRGTPQFPCSVYRTVLSSYAGGEVPWHGSTFILHPGDGMFVNGGVLHRTRESQKSDCIVGSIVFEMPVLTGSLGSVFEEQYFRPLYQHPALAVVCLKIGRAHV